MLFRRISEHVRAQNWFAVGLDFLIVVAGVFLGVQLGNWNQARGDAAAYEMALERYRGEIETNLATLDTADAETQRRLGVVSHAFNLLQACEDTPQAREAIEFGLRGIMGTTGLSLRRTALDDLTRSPVLLAGQTEAERRRFNDTGYLMGLFLREADYAELMPLDERVQNNPLLEIGPSADQPVTYFGENYSRRDRQLQLAVPVDIACRDNDLVKSFYTWERWQLSLPAISRVLRTRLEADLEWLDAGE